MPLVDTMGNGPVRCTRCHAYMNPCCRFLETGGKWLCCMCNHENETPEHYFNHLDMQ